jgi:glucosamine-6-phosphate deaminase
MTARCEKAGPPDIQVFDTAASLAEHAADIIVRVQHRCRREGRPFVLGLAAGASPKGIYRVLAEGRERGAMRFDDCVTFCLDEYYPMYPQSPRSFYQELSMIQSRLGIPEANRHFLKGDMPLPDIPAHCAGYEATIRNLGGIDLQLLGVGRNGHIGFNEPGATHDSRTRLVQLDETTRMDALPLFDVIDAVPEAALTMGVGTILEAGALLLVAKGPYKQSIMKRFIHETPTPRIPVTLLKQHAALHVLVDAAASPKSSTRSAEEEAL